MSSNLTEEVRHSSGGYPISVEMAPYAVVVRCEDTGVVCTGTLVALDIVLTMARCFFQGDQLKESSLEVLAGVDTLANTSLSNGRTQRQKGVLAIHPNFYPTKKDASFGYNDIALVFTENNFTETSTVRAITVGFLDWSKIDEIKCVVPSFGVVNPLTPSQFDDLLKRTEVVVSHPCPCHDTLRKAFGSRTQRWLCASPKKSGPTPCVGAGGAGMVCGDKLIGLLVGLVSFHDLSRCEYSRKTSKVSCDNSKSVPVFLELCPFMPWFQYVDERMPKGPINCSKATNVYSSLYGLFVVVCTFIK